MLKVSHDPAETVYECRSKDVYFCELPFSHSVQTVHFSLIEDQFIFVCKMVSLLLPSCIVIHCLKVP